jgi:hypothetical protein
MGFAHCLVEVNICAKIAENVSKGIGLKEMAQNCLIFDFQG